MSIWADYLAIEESDSEIGVIRQHTGTGRPAGRAVFIESLERVTGKSLRKGRPGPKSGMKWSTNSGHRVKAVKCHNEVRNDNRNEKEKELHGRFQA